MLQLPSDQEDDIW